VRSPLMTCWRLRRAFIFRWLRRRRIERIE
jgi:hypothetical protein